ncbi:hypothetical protein GCM10023080_031330 [Streptomyces pseudoechinosporeus]
MVQWGRAAVEETEHGGVDVRGEHRPAPLPLRGPGSTPAGEVTLVALSVSPPMRIFMLPQVARRRGNLEGESAHAGPPGGLNTSVTGCQNTAPVHGQAGKRKIRILSLDADDITSRVAGLIQQH